MNAYIGHESQMTGCFRFTYDDGPLRGTPAVEVYNETGLRMTVLLGRGMDIAYASYKGASLAYVGKTGFTSPVYFQHGGKEWGRAFSGGLVTTCGLNNVGPGGEYGGESVGDHGRFSSLTAERVAIRQCGEGDGAYWEIGGQLREAAIFGENFCTARTIRCYLRQNVIELYDTVRNEAFESQPLMLMYHCNFGYPLLSEGARLLLEPAHSRPRDERAAKGFAQYRRILPPASGFAEQVFYHEGARQAALCGGGMRLDFSWSADTLPCLTQWNMFGAGDYVLGLEPGNCHPVGRAQYLAGEAEWLAPGGEKKTWLRFAVTDAAEQPQGTGG